MIGIPMQIYSFKIDLPFILLNSNSGFRIIEGINPKTG